MWKDKEFFSGFCIVCCCSFQGSELLMIKSGRVIQKACAALAKVTNLLQTQWADQINVGAVATTFLKTFSTLILSQFLVVSNFDLLCLWMILNCSKNLTGNIQSISETLGCLEKEMKKTMKTHSLANALLFKYMCFTIIFDWLWCLNHWDIKPKNTCCITVISRISGSLKWIVLASVYRFKYKLPTTTYFRELGHLFFSWEQFSRASSCCWQNRTQMILSWLIL